MSLPAVVKLRMLSTGVGKVQEEIKQDIGDG
jgi:hypothetical protein